MSQLSHPPYYPLSQRDLPPLVQFQNHSGTIVLHLNLLTYPPRIITVSGSGVTTNHLPLGKHPLLPLVQHPTEILAWSLTNLSNDESTQSYRHSSTPSMCIEPSQLQLPSLHPPRLSTPPLSPDLSPNTLESPPMSPLIHCPRPPTPLTPPSLAHPPNHSQSLLQPLSPSKRRGTPPMYNHLRVSTQWDHYLCTQGGRLCNPLYNATTPTRRKVKKPRRYASTLEDRWEQELAACNASLSVGPTWTMKCGCNR
jgi:hypothetical protein